MVKCAYCGKEVSMPFVCPYCGQPFCAEHRLPENHECPNMPKEPFTYQRKSKEEKRIKEGEFYFIRESSGKENSHEIVKKKKFGRIILAFSMILIIASITVAFTSYNIGNSQGYQVGYNEGKQSGYEFGYSQGYNDGNVSGYNVGYLKGVEDGVGRGYNIRDPTYQEVLTFIASDQTDKNQYNEENYTCANFAADFKNHAFEAGYRCGYVLIEFPDAAHSINCFNTTDKGLIFIEPQDDNIVSLTIGQPYWNRTIYESPTYNDTIVRYTIVW